MGVEPSLVFNGLVALAFSLITGQTQFSVICVSNGIFSPDFAQVIGPFHKLIPLNVFRNEEDTLRSYLNRIKENQNLWHYLKECPSSTLQITAPSQSTKTAAELLKKMIKWHLLPASAFPLFKGIKNSLSASFGNGVRHSSQRRPIYLQVNELQLKDFSNFCAYHRKCTLECQSKKIVGVRSILTQTDWLLSLSWRSSEENQRLLSQHIEHLMTHFISNRDIRLAGAAVNLNY
jgi:hypothetical protein